MSLVERTTDALTGDTVVSGTSLQNSERWGEFLYTLRHNPMTVFGVCILIVIMLVGLFAPVIAPYGPLEKNLADTGEPPSATYWLGTDAYGHDIFSRILYGARIDLVIAISAIAVSMESARSSALALAFLVAHSTK